MVKVVDGRFFIVCRTKTSVDFVIRHRMMMKRVSETKES